MAQGKIRIVSVVTNLVMGGDANRLLNFARTVDRRRFEHHVLTLVRPDHHELCRLGLMMPQFERYQIQVDTLGEEPRIVRRRAKHGPFLVWSDAVSCMRVLLRLTRYLRQHKTDVIDARMSYATFFGVMAARLAHIPVVVSTYYGPDEAGSGRMRQLITRAVCSQLDSIVSDSEYAINTLSDFAFGQRPRAAVIPNGIFVPIAERHRSDVRRFFDIPGDPEVRVICQVSRLVPLKGHRVLLDAARHVLDHERKVVFLLCGHSHPPSYIEELRRQAVELGIAESVRIAGYPGPIGDVWGAVDIHVHASVRDSSPIAIYESMAVGLPSIVTNAGGIPELVRDGSTALVVPAGDAGRLAEALLRILRDPALGLSLAAAARQRYCEHYRVERMTRALEDLFSSLVLEHSAVLSEAA